MALFSKKETEEKVEDKVEKKTTKSQKTSTSVVDYSRILRNPRITEKTAIVSSGSVYVFDVDPRANKTQVKKAVETIYKVKPIKVNITKIAKKPVKSRKIRKTYYKGGGKKAYVYLKKGETIQFA
jgi:large subunit ribosomal protein L23